MTGYTVNTGATTKFSENWDRIFSGGRAAAGKGAKKAAAPAKAAAAKPAGKAAKGTKAAVKKSAEPARAKTVKSKQASQQALTSGKR